MSGVEKLSAEEKRAYDLITAEDGLLQSELWKRLDASSRKGSRLARSLAEKDLVEREKTVSSGRTTYLLKPTNGDGSTTTWEGNEPVDEPGDNSQGDEKKLLNEREQRALLVVQEHNGIYQSEFWKELDISSRTGSRIASSLEEKGLIRREEAVYNEQRTYFLKPAEKDLDFSMLMAGSEISPIVGDEDIDPIASDEFTQWVLQLAREQR